MVSVLQFQCRKGFRVGQVFWVVGGGQGGFRVKTATGFRVYRRALAAGTATAAGALIGVIWFCRVRAASSLSNSSSTSCGAVSSGWISRTCVSKNHKVSRKDTNPRVRVKSVGRYCQEGAQTCSSSSSSASGCSASEASFSGCSSSALLPAPRPKS